MTRTQTKADPQRFERLRQELEAELRSSPEVETVALGKEAGVKSLVVLVKKDAPTELKARWQEAGRIFKGVPVVARDWGNAYIPMPPGYKPG